MGVQFFLAEEELPPKNLWADCWPTVSQLSAVTFFVKTCSKHDTGMIIILTDITCLPINGKMISFQDVYGKLMKCITDTSLIIVHNS